MFQVSFSNFSKAIMVVSLLTSTWCYGWDYSEQVPERNISVKCDGFENTQLSNFIIRNVGTNCDVMVQTSPSKIWPGKRTFYLIETGFGGVYLDLGGEKGRTFYEDFQINGEGFYTENSSKLNVVKFSSGFINMDKKLVTKDIKGLIFDGCFMICVSPFKKNEKPCKSYSFSKRIPILQQ